MAHLDLDDLQESLRKIVNPAYDERVHVERALEDGGITGYVVKKGWRGVPIAKRQAELYEYLHQQFREKSEDVSLLFTMTPEEFEAWSEDRAEVA